MHGFIDLHCHWLFGVDDGARTPSEARAMLTGLYELGFDEVVATPHIRPEMFNNTPESLRQAFLEQQQLHSATTSESGPVALLPKLSLGAEHFFTDAVHERIVSESALPYRGAKAILIELPEGEAPYNFELTLSRLRRGGLVPVVAHPERYRSLWRTPTLLGAWLDAGAAALLDVGALVGKYGSAAEDAALRFLKSGCYAAACSDAHRPADIAVVKDGLSFILTHYGESEIQSLFHRGPRAILEGTITA